MILINESTRKKAMSLASYINGNREESLRKIAAAIKCLPSDIDRVGIGIQDVSMGLDDVDALIVQVTKDGRTTVYLADNNRRDIGGASDGLASITKFKSYNDFYDAVEFLKRNYRVNSVAVAYEKNGSNSQQRVGQWYLVCADEHAAESEYDRIARGELKRPDEIATETTVRIFGPFDSAYDANLRWWEEYGREAIGAREGITDFDVECAENEYEPDCPRDSGWQSNGDDDMRDWCRTRYDVVNRFGMLGYRRDADEVIMMGRQ